MVTINQQISIPDDEFAWSYVRSGGPGGQNVNKVASKAVLRWDIAASTALPEDVKIRLALQQKRFFTIDGGLIITSQRHRDQDRNRKRGDHAEGTTTRPCGDTGTWWVRRRHAWSICGCPDRDNQRRT